MTSSKVTRWNKATSFGGTTAPWGPILFHTLVAWGLILASSIPSLAQVAPEPPGPVPLDPAPAQADEPGVETLTRGPVHEAFANPSDFDPTPGPVVAKQPPADVPEDPPDYMPEGAEWIPGYWSWDDERDDFIWVTGVARIPPPGQRWVPGYFTEADGGWQRVSGFWVGDEVYEVDYRTEAPPQTLETGPSSPAPADNYFWIPGSWVYYDTGYRWNAGYWTPYQPDWIWVPARWVWTPAGFVYCPGYWDYRLAYRGQMFAPVYFTNPVYVQPGWSYRPWCVIPTTNLFIHLWLRPRWGSYYFGNYYGAQFASLGFTPWANLTIVNRQRYFYDPFFTYAHVHYRRQGVDYIGRVQGWHRYYNDHADLRPARTWHEQQRVVQRMDKTAVQTQLVARNLTEVARRQDAPVRLTQLDEQKKRTQKQHAEKLRELDSERKKIERTAGQTAARLPTRPEAPGEDRERGKAGEGKGKAASLVERAEKGGKGPDGKADQAGGRHGPKLALPKADLPTTTGAVATSQAGGEDRTGAKKGPPPKPSPVSRAGDDRGPRVGRGDDTKGGEKGSKTARTRDDGKAPIIEQPRLPGATDRPTAGQNFPGAGRDKGGKSAGRPNELPQVDRPGRPAELPKVNQPLRAGTPDVITPGTSNLPKAGDRGQKGPSGVEVPGGRGPLPKAGQRIELPSKSNEAPRGKATSPQGDRGGGDRSRGGQKGPPSSTRTEALRPTINREAPAPMPRVEPRVEPRPMPRVETPAAPRPMPKVNVPRENNPPPRVETPRAQPTVDRGGGRERGGPQADRSEGGPSAAKGGGKGKTKGRDDN